MTEQIQRQIDRLGLQDPPDPPDEADVTDEFFSIVEQIPYGSVIKSKQFKLLHGTHALEVMNPKLDSSLLKVVEFDLDSVQDIDEVNSVICQLFEALTAWLDNNSLSVSVFSCAYIEKLLVNYGKFGKGNLSFYDSPPAPINMDESGASDVLLNIVLRPFCVCLIQFVKFVVKLGLAGVIYEEEDLNTQTMDLDLLQNVDPKESLKELENSIRWLEKRDHIDGYNFCLRLLRLLSLLLQIPSLLDIRLEPYRCQQNAVQANSLTSISNSLSECFILLQSLQKSSSYVAQLPKLTGCFSTNPQKRLNNRSPPKPVVLLSYDEALDSLKKLVSDSLLVLNLTKTRNSIQLVEFLSCCMNQRESTNDEEDVSGLHVVARAWLQLFLIRDDEGIMGSPTYNIGSFLYDFMLKICVQDAKILDGTDETVDTKIRALLTDLKVPFYNFLTCVSQNPSRQRQFVSKELVYWDKFQVESENLEASVNASIPDNFDGASFPVLPIASFVYYAKLVRMISFMLESVELNLFKDLRELNVGYWLTSYLIDYLIQHINRLLDVCRLRQRQLAAFPKRIKKAKTDKKRRLREEYERKKMHAEQFVQTTNYLAYQVSRYSIYRNMIELKLVHLQMLNYYGYMKLPKLCKVSEELLFGLQLKPFQSIGIPQLPSFSDYKDAMQKFNDAYGEVIKNKDFKYFRRLVKTKTADLNGFFKSIQPQLTTLDFPSFLGDLIRKDLTELKRSSIYSELALNELIKLLEEDPSNSEKLSTSIQRLGHHLYFPKLNTKVKEKTAIDHYHAAQ
ncbi:DEKNAAC104462 [Brettanomyces naardenensis]|uniref:DEKNAAC104462 n=1 Tax=Brettanomyces naardenensis TaxID=13370 RepID=A0A448YRD7_BRENA|nr:DEKNAAC104462 [Brettanomyces naardenensis]